jgi:hypothetical protein
MSAENGGEMILKGGRPSLEKMCREHSGWVGLIEKCWTTSEEDRPKYGEFEASLMKLTPTLLQKIVQKRRGKKKKGRKVLVGEREREGKGEGEEGKEKSVGY